MNRLEIENFNYKFTLFGGQTFSWEKLSEKEFYGIVESSIIFLKIEKNKIFWQTYPNKDNNKLIKTYFNLEKENQYWEKIDKLKNKNIDFLSKAVENVYGLRILKQPINQTIISFLLSSVQNIKNIRKQFKQLISLYGEKINIQNKSFYTFPSIERLSQISTKELMEKTKIGFRAKYIKMFLLDLIENKNKEWNLNNLIKIKGIGPKIADCIGVFSLGIENRTPIDRWIKKYLIEFYKCNAKKYEDIQKFLQNQFGEENVAIAGQYIFEYIRHKSTK